MKLLAIVVLVALSLWFRPTAHAQQFFKLDSPAAVSTAQVEQVPTQKLEALKPAENASEAKPAETPPVAAAPTPVTCNANQWVRADNGQCIDKPAPARTQAYTQPTVQAAPVSGCGDNFYANYIYMHESGCRTTAVNSIGCRGIGQACPGNKMPCGDDYACQNAYFTNYAISRYGSWQHAYEVWLSQHWW